MQFPFLTIPKFILLAVLAGSLQFLSFNSPVNAQGIGSGKNIPLSYHWEINLKGAKADPVLLLKNTGKTTLNALGWTIYFNSIKKPFFNDNTHFMELTAINGDLFSLKAGTSYQPLKPGDSCSFHMSVPDLRNATELPIGFYLVFDRDVKKGYSIPDTSPKIDSIELAIASRSYAKNQQITRIKEADLPLIFPTPQSLKRENGYFNLTSKTTIVANAAFKNEAVLLASNLQDIFGNKVVIRQVKTANTIELVKGTSPDGGYILSVNTSGVKITAATPEGMFDGIQSLKILLPPNVWAARQTAIKVPSITIKDAPRFGHRAFMLDVARNFQPKKELLKILDLMALYKMNVLHLHLNDDEGWRLAIPGLPELTTVGAKRGHTLDSKDRLPPSYGSGPDTTNTFGTGYYSRKDFLEILVYARNRHITVIPEVESPGHARAAIKSMDARYRYYMAKGLKEKATEYLLRDLADSSVYHSVQGWHDNVMNVAMPSTYTFIKKVTDEIVKLYAEAGAPLKTIHMGGDEVPEGVWERSPVAKKMLASDPAIQSVYGLWKYYFTRVNEILQQHQLYLSGWEEIGLKKIAGNGKKRWVVDSTVADRNYHTDVWNNIIGTGNEDLAYRLANAGFKVSATNVTNMYFDMAYNSSFFEHGMNWAGFVDVDKPFYFVPFNYYLNTSEDEYGRPVSKNVFKSKAPLKAAAQENIIGIQSALWTETINKEGILEYLLLPKLFGSAERAWAKDPDWAQTTDSLTYASAYQQAFSVFASTVGLRELPRMDYYSGGFLYRIPEPGVICVNGLISANVLFPGLSIHYTTDGTEPTMKSLLYTTPVRSKGVMTFRVFNGKGRGGKAVVVYP